jgi:hypothetical protein
VEYQIDTIQGAQFLERDTADLYGMLVPETLRAGRLYSREGLAARGRQIFMSVLEDTKESICEQYRKRKETIGDSVQLMALIGGVLLAVHVAVPIMPMAALVVKIGINELCIESD